MIGILLPQAATAQVQRSFINQSFEQPVIGTNACSSIIHESLSPGWSTTHSAAGVSDNWGRCNLFDASGTGGFMEYWRQVFQGVPAADGQQFVELNAREPSRLYQTVCLVTGEQLPWRFSHRGRRGVDTMYFNIAPTPTGTRSIITTVATGNTSWANYSGSYTFNGTSGLQTLGFESTTGTNEGNFLDNIQVTLTPYVELNPGPGSGAESIPTTNLPTLRVAGTLTAPITVQMTVGGTAILGTDYTTPSGTNTFSVTIPAGDYDGSQAVATGVVVLDDKVIETNKTIQFTMGANPSVYTIAGTQTCGAPAVAAATYTIIDDDANVTITKVSQGGTGTFGFTGTNGVQSHSITTTASGSGVAGPAQALTAASTATTITESTPPSGFTLTGISCTGLGSGGSATPNLGNRSVTLDAAATVAGSTIACTFTNTKQPTVQVTKISQGGTGTFSFSGNNGIQSHSITTSASGSGVAGPVQTLTTAGTSTTITESAPPAGFTLSAISCSGLGSGGSATPNLSSRSVTLDAAATSAGAAIACTFTNTKQPTAQVTKISEGGTGTFNFGGNNGIQSHSITTSVSGSGVAGPVQTLTTIGASTTITESAPPAGFTLSAISCSGLGSGGSATPNLSSRSVTLDAAATSAGAAIACTFTNTKQPTVQVTKISEGGTGTFNFGGNNGIQSHSITTSVSGSGVAGPVQTLTTIGASTTITESAPPAGFTLTAISCSGLGSGGSATPNLSSRSVTLDAAATSAGAAIACTFTNTKQPTIQITKVSQSGTGTFSFSGTNGVQPHDITTTASGTGVSGPVQTLTAAGAATTITETARNDYYAPEISCSGLGQGGTYSASGTTVQLDAAAVAAGAAIKCTYVNRHKLPQLEVTKTVDQASISAPGVLNYTITVRNTGDGAATNVNVTDTQPDGQPATLSGPAGDAGTAGVLDAGETWTYTASYTVTQAAIDAGTALVNHVSVTSTETPTAVTAEASTTIEQTPALEVTKIVDKAKASAVGDVLTYTITVKNSGNVKQTNVNVSDTLPNGQPAALSGPTGDGGTAGALDVGETWTYTTTYTVTQADLDAGTDLANTVSAKSDQVTSPVTAKATTQIQQVRSLSIDKDVDKKTTTTVGDVLTYRITARNTGNVSLINVTVTDTLPDGSPATLTGPSGDTDNDGALDVGEVWTYTTTYAVKQADIDAGQNIVNTVSANANNLAGPVSDKASTGVALSPGIDIKKDVDRDSISAPGPLVYTITVTNTGNTTLSNVTLSDTLPNGAAGTPTLVSNGNGNPQLDVGEQWVYSITYNVTQAEIDAGQDLKNTVKVDATDPSGQKTDADTAVTSINTLARVDVTKTVDKTTISKPGTLTYTIRARNTGNVSLQNVHPTDAMSNGDTITVGQAVESSPTTAGVMEVGETWTWTVTYTVTQAMIDAGTDLVNTATVTATGPDGTPTNSSGSAQTSIESQPALVVTKVVDKQTTRVAGDVLTYTISVRNSGNVSQTGVNISDTMPNGTAVTPTGPSGDGGTIGTLDVGETWTYTASYTVTQADIDKGTTLVNSAQATSTQVTKPVTATAQTTIALAPELTLIKTQSAGPNPATAAGQVLTYTISVRNSGNVSQTGVIVSDTMPDGTAVTPTGPSGDGGTIGTLDVGETWTYTASYTVTQADIDKGGTLVNRAQATSSQVRSPVGDTAETPTTASPILTLAKSIRAGSPFTKVGDTVSYSYLVTNNGNVTITQPIKVSDDQIAQVSCPALPPGGLAPKGTLTCTASYTITQADLDAGSVTNKATATDGTTTSNEVSATATATKTPSLTLAKSITSGSPFAKVGDKVSYNYVITNSGNVTITQPVSVNDDKIAQVTCPALSPGGLAPKGTLTCTASYTITQADLDAGSVTNKATATDGTTTSPETSATATATKAPGLTLVKSITSGSPFTKVGDKVTYNYVITNSGNVTITQPVSVNDDKIAQVTCPALPPGGLAPKGTLTCTASYTITQADLDAGSVTNKATATDGTTTSPQATATATATKAPRLTLAKSISAGSPFTKVGDTVSYSYLVTNNGNVTITQPIKVSDDKIAQVSCPALPPGGLAPNGTLTCTASYTITQADLDAGSVTNKATATDGTTTSPETSATATATAKPGITVEKKAGTPSGNTVGSTIAYSFVVTNTGNMSLNAIKVSDDKLSTAPVCPATSLAPQATMTCTGTYTLTQDDLNAGQVVNKATAAGTPASGGDPITSAPSEATTKLTPKASLSVVKAAGKPSGNTAGSTIAYTFTITNTGDVNLKDVTVTDTLPNVVITGGPIALLTPGQVDSTTITALYTLTQDDVDAGQVVNSATAGGTPTSGGDPVTSETSQVTMQVEQNPKIQLLKTGKLNDLNGNGVFDPGDTITYALEVSNTGNVVVNDIVPNDAGPTFNGKTATGKLGSFTPGPTKIAPGQKQSFTATYTLTQDDIDNAAGIKDGVSNSATARGYYRGGSSGGIAVDAPESKATVELPAALPSDVAITKQAGLREIRRGEKAPFTIKVTNKTNRNIAGLNVMDRMPSGFRYVDGSATINGTAVTPTVNGLNVLFENLAVGPKADVVIRLQMLALSSAGPGKHVNRARVTGPAGNVLAPEATASVEIVVEPVFDCSEIIGKVFDDLNDNGYQDEGEPGLPSVRVATVRGLLVTTDKFGRFHVACADIPDDRIGSNFIMKLDTRTLPTGYRVTTENPRVIRLTRGKMSKLNFGASLGRVVRLDLKDEAFIPGSLLLREQWDQGLNKLIEVLKEKPSTLRIGYLSKDKDLAMQRMDAVQEDVAKRWKSVGGGYELNIEARVEAGQ